MRYFDEFKSDLELLRNSLVATNLSCEQLDTLLTQVNIFAFSLASLDIRQESIRHSDGIEELTRHLELSKDYADMNEVHVLDTNGSIINVYEVGQNPGDFAIWKK